MIITSSEARARWRISIAAAVLLTSATVLTFVLAVVPPLRHRIEFANYKTDLSAAEVRACELDGTVSELRGVASREPLEPRTLDTSAALNAHLATLSHLGEANHLDIERLDPGEIIAGPRHAAVPVRLGGRGSYPDCVRFLTALHQRLPDMGLTGLTMSRSAASGGAEFTIDMAWYVQSPAARP